MGTSKFSSVETAPPIEVFALSKAYADDPFAQKVNLGVGAYRTDEGKPWVLPVVHEMERRLAGCLRTYYHENTCFNFFCVF